MRRGCEIFSLLFLLVFFMNFGSALNANFSSINPFFDLGGNSVVNFTVGAMDENITRIVITFQSSTDAFNRHVVTSGTNWTSAAGTNFTLANVTSSSVYYTLNFTNTSEIGIVPNGTTRDFSFNISSGRMATLLDIVVNVTGVSGTYNSSPVTVGHPQRIVLNPSFSFEGYVVNETGCSTCWQNNTNVTIYGVMDTPGGGPRTSTALATTQTNSSGYFNLARINNSANFNGFSLKTIFYNDSGVATKVGTIMPEFPSFMFMAGSGEEGEFEMSLNGATFYLQPAVTLNISANNGSHQVSFGYEVVDQALGFPIESVMMNKVNTATIIVPANRGYTISFFRMFAMPGSSFGYENDQALCGGTDFMNDTHCPAPPKSYSINSSTASSGAVVTVNHSLVVRRAQVSGCINISLGANNSAVNITDVNLKMVPWSLPSGIFIPPSDADDGSVNLSDPAQFNTSYGSGCFAYYNLSLLNESNYFLEIYAKNASDANGNPGDAYNLAGFQNLTATEGAEVNITLFRLVGAYRTDATSGVNVNTSLIKIGIINSTGHYITTNVNANLKIKNTVAGIGTIYYMINQQDISNGAFYIPVLNNSNYAKIMVFSNNGPPKETTLNLSRSETNITITSLGADKGFRKFNRSDNASLEELDQDSFPVQLRFLRTDPECDLPFAPQSCVITEMNASSFNPLKALLAGKVNMEVRIIATNVSIIFHDYDMFSAKAPPMDSIFNEGAEERDTTSGSTAVEDTWNFGSFAPSDSYSNVTIVIPYSDSSSSSSYLNDSAEVNVSVPLFYDENQAVLWNSSEGDDLNDLPDDFLEYNNSYYDDFLVNSGAQCNSSSNTSLCFINTSSNFISLHIPHFSTLSAVVSGSATLVAAAEPNTDSGSSGGGSGETGFWTVTYPTLSETQFNSQEGYTKEIAVKGRIGFKVENETHYLGVVSVNIARGTATINVSSTPQQKKMAVGEEWKVNVDGDNNNDILIKLNNISSDNANVTIYKINESVLIDSSGSSSNAGDYNVTSSDEETKEETKWSMAKIFAISLIVLVLLGVLVFLSRKFLFLSAEKKIMRSINYASKNDK